MQPTGSVLCMMIAAQRLHHAPPILSKRRREPAVDVRIARTAEVNEPDLAEKARRKAILGLTSHQQHPPVPDRCSLETGGGRPA